MSIEELKNRMDGILKMTGMNPSFVPNYVKSKKIEMGKEITDEVMKGWRKREAKVSSEMVILYAEIAGVLPSWILEDSFENNIRNAIFKQFPNRKKIYVYNVKKNVKKALDEYRKENMETQGKYWNKEKPDEEFLKEFREKLGITRGKKARKYVNLEEVMKISKGTGKGIDEILLGKSEILDEVNRLAEEMIAIVK